MRRLCKITFLLRKIVRFGALFTMFLAVYAFLMPRLPALSSPAFHLPAYRYHMAMRRLRAHMLYMDSAYHNFTCSTVMERELTNKSLPATFYNKLTLRSGSSHNGSVVDCETLKVQRGFGRWPVTPQEEQFPLAFSFKVHKSPDMFVRLLSVLWRPHNLYCVHVDAKTPDSIFQQIQNVSRCFNNVVLTDTRVDVVYASISSLNADLACVKVALNSTIPWKYHINLCGQDFPLKTNLEMVQILTAMNGTNDVENYPPTKMFSGISFKYKSAIVKGMNLPTSILKDPFPLKSVQLRKGSAYNCLHRSFLEWSLQDQINQKLLKWLQDTWAPDELFWATLSHRAEAPGGPQTLIQHQDNTVLSKAVNWQWDPYKCQGFYVHFICIFSSKDLPWLLSRHELVANKFYIEKDSTILDCLEAQLERRALQGYKELLWARHGEFSTSDLQPSSGQWPLVSSLNWTLYRSLPQFSKHNG